MLPLIFLLTLSLVRCDNIDSIECPIPGNPTSVTEEDCTFSACEYTNGQCHMKKNSEAGYLVASDPVDTGIGFRVQLRKANDSTTLFGGDITDLFLDFVYHEDYHLQIKITDTSESRYEVPFELNLPSTGNKSDLYDISISEVWQPLVINVTRKSNGNSVFRSVGPLTYENQFIQFTMELASSDLYGLGENYHTSLRHSFDPRATYPIFSSDKGTYDPAQYNHYGAHPYYVNVEDNEGNTHSLLFYNSDAIEYSTFFMENETPAITFRSIGGIVDLHLFLGPTPEDVNSQYSKTIGTPNIPPYWSLGFTLSRWGYKSSANYRVVRDRMRDAQIPMDVQTFDIDYMDGRRDFTYDQVNWWDFPELIEELHNESIYITVIFDPAVAIEWDTYSPASRGRDADAYIKWSSSDLVPSDQPEGAADYIVGRVWPDSETVFPDFFHPSTKQWWANETKIFHDIINFDAMWIDMNEVSNFDTNLDNGVNKLFCPDNEWDNPPYGTKATFNDINQSKKLSDKTICMSSLNNDGTKSYMQYDTHSLYGFSEIIASYNAMESIFPGKRQTVLSRSTFVGSGRYAIHWLGDNEASWDQMSLSVVGIIEFNMFGMPMVGADICGFGGATTMELCARWMELGAFYPFCRNHNNIREPDQDPAVWPEVADISRDVLLLRYKYLPYLYSLLHRANSDGNSVVRPLFNVFPSDLTARGIDDQFMWGDAILVAPVMVLSAVTRAVYFPESRWYELDTGVLAEVGPITTTVDAPLEKIPVYVRGGKILPNQGPAVTTTESRLNGFGFTVSLDENLRAEGEVFWDDGVTDQTSTSAFFALLNFESNQFSMTIERNPDEAAGIAVETVDFFGFPSSPSSVTVNGEEMSQDQWMYNTTSSVLTVNPDVPLNEPITIYLNY